MPDIHAAERAFQAENYDLAESIVAEILSKAPKDGAALLLSGLIRIKKNQPGEAIDFLRAALDVAPGDKMALKWLLISLRHLSRFEEAVDVGIKAVALWPNEDEFLLGLGIAQVMRRQLDEGVANLQKAAQMQPRNHLAHHYLGVAYELLGSDGQASTHYRLEIEAAPTRETGYLELGRLLLSHGNYVQLLSLGRSALQQFPNSAKVHLLIAQGYREVGEHDLFREHLDKALAFDPEVELTAAFLLQEDGEFETADRLFRRSIERKPRQGSAYSGLLSGRKATLQDEPLLSAMEGLLQDPTVSEREKAMLHYGLGKAADDQGQYEQAMKHFDQANDLNRRHFLEGRKIDAERNMALLNKMFAMFTKESMEKNRDLGSESNVPIFVVGMIRSGTTLVEQILASHPDVGPAGEQRFWLTEIPHVLDLQKGVLHREKFIEMRDRYLQVLRTLQPDSQRITDKMPLNFSWLGGIHLAYPKSPIVHVQRSPTDNALSIYMTDLAKPPYFAYDKANIVAGYIEYLKTMEHWRNLIPSSALFEIQYEDLIGDQEHWTRKLIEFCGLDWSEECLQFQKNKRRVNTPSVWQVRQPIYKSSVAKWKNYEPWLGEFRELLNYGS